MIMIANVAVMMNMMMKNKMITMAILYTIGMVMILMIIMIKVLNGLPIDSPSSQKRSPVACAWSSSAAINPIGKFRLEMKRKDLYCIKIRIMFLLSKFDIRIRPTLCYHMF